MKKIILITALILVGCQTAKNVERIVITDTTHIVTVDTIHIIIRDTLEIKHYVKETIFDTLYNFIDSVVVKELIKNVYNNITTTFKYDTLYNSNDRLIAIKIFYDGIFFDMDINEKLLKYNYVIREKKEDVPQALVKSGHLEEFYYWIIIGGLILILAIAWRFSKK